ncbi:MAG: hypothetical protein Q7T50_02185, partial [Candidatus Magasanikbacteria bacterium]|nr:hypothetical protein [Candidatus Magasanikbacteria bacterium]
IFFVFAVCQIPFVQKQIVRYTLPSCVNIVQMKSYGVFPVYIRVPILVLQKDQHDFVTVKNGVLDLRYFLLRRQVAFDAAQLIIHKQPSQPQQPAASFSVGDVLAQLSILSFFHDFNIDSLQYKDKEKIQMDYKIDWDLKLNLVKMYAKRNDNGPYPQRVEIDGTTKKNDVENGQIKVVLNDGLGVDGTFTMQNSVIKTDLSLRRKGEVIAKIQPTLDVHHIDKGVSIESLNVISPFFQLAGTGHIATNPIVATVKNDRFFLGLAKKIKNAVIGRSN